MLVRMPTLVIMISTPADCITLNKYDLISAKPLNPASCITNEFVKITALFARNYLQGIAKITETCCHPMYDQLNMVFYMNFFLRNLKKPQFCGEFLSSVLCEIYIQNLIPEAQLGMSDFPTKFPAFTFYLDEQISVRARQAFYRTTG
jgi:hypothetical protein